MQLVTWCEMPRSLFIFLLSSFSPSFSSAIDRARCTRVGDLESAGETKLSHCIVRNSPLIRSSRRLCEQKPVLRWVALLCRVLFTIIFQALRLKIAKNRDFFLHCLSIVFTDEEKGGRANRCSIEYTVIPLCIGNKSILFRTID